MKKPSSISLKPLKLILKMEMLMLTGVMPIISSTNMENPIMIILKPWKLVEEAKKLISIEERPTSISANTKKLRLISMRLSVDRKETPSINSTWLHVSCIKMNMRQQVNISRKE